MSKQPFAARKPDSFSGEPPIDELESTRTAALARIHPNEITRDEADEPEDRPAGPQAEIPSTADGPAGDVTDFRLRINSIEPSLDGGTATFEGEIQIEEYLNDQFISRITILLSILGAGSMPIGEVEARLLEAARARLRAAADLSPERMETCLEQTRHDEDMASL